MKSQLFIGFSKQSVKVITVVIFLFWIFLSHSSFSQVRITEKAPDSDSLVQMAGVQNIDTTYSFRWNQNLQQWELFSRNLDFYNDEHKLLTRIHQEMTKGKWLNHDRIIKSYNENEELSETLSQEWNENLGDWVNLKLRTITYDNRGNKKEILYQQWRKALGEWFSTIRYLIEYNRNDAQNYVLIKTYSPEQNKWYNHQKYLFFYDDGYGPPDEVLIKKWDPALQEWKKTGNYYLNHNFRGKKTLEIRSTWNESMKKWINGLKYEYDYDKKLLIEQIEYRWNNSENRWVKALKKEFEYNDQNKVTEEWIFRWDSTLNNWKLRDHYLHAIEKPGAIED